MNKRTQYFISVLLGILLVTPVFAQDAETEDKPIRPPFETTLLIDQQTTVNPYKGSLSMEIQHRFSKIQSISDLFGLYGTANTRMALTYGITDKLSLAFGTTRGYQLQDLEWKYSVFTQTRSGKIPVSLSYCGNVVLDARPNRAFRGLPRPGRAARTGTRSGS